MALATLENVVATVGTHSHNVSLTIEEDGLVVGAFGKLPWAGSEVEVEVGGDGFMLTMSNGPAVATHYFVPVASFASFGGARSMKTFASFLLRSATSAGARTPVAA
jgi:hypothetical protein